MDLFLTITILIGIIAKQLGLGLAIGSSTYALIFFFQSIRDGNIDGTEKRFMHTVYAVLRISWAILIAGELILLALTYSLGGIGIKGIPTMMWLDWIIFAVLFANAFLMSKHKMPMRIGPALAGGSWYALFFLNVLTGPLSLQTYPFWWILAGYVVFLFVFFGILEIIKLKFMPPRSSAPTIAPATTEPTPHS